jgi:LPXTG-motif cell wall-anchored protein
MNLIQQIRRSGSIVTFAIIGVILVCVLAGTVCVLKQHGNQVRKDKAIAVFENQQRTKTDNGNHISEVSSTGNNTASVTSVSSSVVSQNLPKTGLNTETIISQFIGVYCLSASIVGYVLSRRNLTRYL